MDNESQKQATDSACRTVMLSLLFDGISWDFKWRGPRLINKLHIIMHRPIKCISNIQQAATTTIPKETLQ